MAQNSQGRSVMVQGRLVWLNGDLFAGRIKTDMNTKQPKLDQLGNKITEYGFGLAVPKSVLSQTGENQPGQIWAAIHEEAFTLYPNRQIPPNFAMKYKDGDGIDDKGRPFAEREGYAGHIIFAMTTQVPIKFFKFEGGNNILVNEGIKCGDYVNVQVYIKAHPAVGTHKPGLFLNPNAVQLLRYGKEIVNTPSGDQIFGTQAPPGLDYTTMPTPQGVTPLMPMAQAPYPGGPVTPLTPVPQPAQPHYGVVPQQFHPPQPAPVPQPQYGQPPYGTPSAPPQYAPQPTGMPPAPR